jgi:hypothetical protein
MADLAPISDERSYCVDDVEAHLSGQPFDDVIMTEDGADLDSRQADEQPAATGMTISEEPAPPSDGGDTSDDKPDSVTTVPPVEPTSEPATGRVTRSDTLRRCHTCYGLMPRHHTHLRHIFIIV